jgi:hypothetical protein
MEQWQLGLAFRALQCDTSYLEGRFAGFVGIFHTIHFLSFIASFFFANIQSVSMHKHCAIKKCAAMAFRRTAIAIVDNQEIK